MKLVIKDLTKSFQDKEVLRGASFEFESDKIYGLLGRNGSGKTTLFNILYGDLDCNSGSFGLEQSGELKTIQTQDIGMVFSENILPDFLTGYEFIKFYMDINRKHLVNPLTPDQYLDMMELDERDRHRIIKGYSHGMKSKISMLCFFISKPKIILLDEPLTSVDVVVSLQIKNLLKQLRQGHIIIFSTHILQLATDLCDEIVLLHNGKLSQLDKNRKDEADFEEFIIDALRKEDTNEN